MDADTRHQLKQNELAQALRKWKSFGDEKTRLTLLIIVLVLLGWIAFRVWRGQQETSLAYGWQELIASIPSIEALADPVTHDKLRAIIESRDDPGLVGMTRLQLGIGLAQAAQDAPEQSDAYLREAVTVLEATANDATAPPLVSAATTFKLAEVFETQREFDKARATYEKLTTDALFEGSPFRSLAESRVESLDEIRAEVVFTPGMPPPASQPATTSTSGPASASGPADNVEQGMPGADAGRSGVPTSQPTSVSGTPEGP